MGMTIDLNTALDLLIAISSSGFYCSIVCFLQIRGKGTDNFSPGSLFAVMIWHIGAEGCATHDNY